MSERIQLEQKVRESEEKHRSILDGIEEAYFEVDLRGNITYVNRAALALTGYDAEELVGMNNRAYTTPETAATMFRIFRKIHDTGQTAEITNYEIIRKDGSKRILEVSASLIRNDRGEPAGFRGVARDVTVQNQEREAWRQYEFIVNAVKDPMTLINRDYVYEVVNDAYTRAYQMKREDILGRSISEVWGSASTGLPSSPPFSAWAATFPPSWPRESWKAGESGSSPPPSWPSPSPVPPSRP